MRLSAILRQVAAQAAPTPLLETFDGRARAPLIMALRFRSSCATPGRCPPDDGGIGVHWRGLQALRAADNLLILADGIDAIGDTAHYTDVGVEIVNSVDPP